MKMSEYTKNEWKRMQDKPLKERLLFFWDYYKWPTILVVLVVVALSYTVAQRLAEKETVLSGILINSTSPMEDPAFLQNFCDHEQIDTKKQEIVLLAGLSLESETPSMGYMTYQRIHAGIAAKDTDFLIADTKALQQCGYDSSNMLMDLRQFLSPEQLAALSGRLYYIDASLRDRDYTGQEDAVTYPSPSAPEEMVTPIPVGIDIHDCKELLDFYYPTNQPLYFSVACNAPHSDRTLHFFEYIMEHTSKE